MTELALQSQLETVQEIKDPLVRAVEGEARVSSQTVATCFQKEHRNVMRDIQNLECSDEFGALNFEHTPYVHPQNGQTYNICNMTRNGFSFLVMGFNGKKAAQWKERFIAAFDQMEEQLRQQQIRPDFSDPRTILGCIQHLQDQVAEKDVVIAGQTERLEKLDRIEHADGSLCISNAAKVLNTRPKDLFAFMSAHQWIFRRVSGPWIGYQSKVQAGYLEHSEYVTRNGDGIENVRHQVRITAKGLVKLSEMLCQPKH